MTDEVDCPQTNMLDESQWVNLLGGFIGGVGVTLVGAFFALRLQRKYERCKKIEETLFDIYMKLMELHGLYFWVTSADVRKERPDRADTHKLRMLAYEIADCLRAADEIQHMEQILDVLFSNRYETPHERNQAIEELLTNLGSSINPRFASIIRKIDEDNLRRLNDNPLEKSNAPGHLR